MFKIILDKKLYTVRENLDFGAKYVIITKIIKRKAKNNSICFQMNEYFKSILIKIIFKVFDEIDKIKDWCNFIYPSNVLKHIYYDVNYFNVSLRKSQL